jgi:hypothetical protein
MPGHGDIICRSQAIEVTFHDIDRSSTILVSHDGPDTATTLAGE